MQAELVGRPNPAWSRPGRRSEPHNAVQASVTIVYHEVVRGDVQAGDTVVLSGVLDAGFLVTHCFPLAEADDALELLD